MKNRRNFDLGRFGRSGPARGRSGTHLERPRNAKLGHLGRQVGRLGRPVGGSGRQVGNLECQVGPLGCFWSFVERVSSANASPSTVRSEFSSDVGTIATSPKLEIRAPTQCFVRVGRLRGSVHNRSDKRRKTRDFGVENRAPERPGTVPGASGRAKSGGKTRTGAQSDCRSHFF